MANCEMVEQMYICITIDDPQIKKKVTSNTIFFSTFQARFFDFFGSFFLVFLFIKVLPYKDNRQQLIFFFCSRLDFSLVFSVFLTMISVGKSRPNIPSIVCTIFGPLNHELEHFSHCDTTLLIENSGVFRLQDNFDKIYNQTSNVVLRATFEPFLQFLPN